MPPSRASLSPAQHDAALGAILGALAGDAAGAVLEFIGHKPSPPEVERAMRYPGGGVHRLAVLRTAKVGQPGAGNEAPCRVIRVVNR